MPEALIRSKLQARKANEIFAHYLDKYLKDQGFACLWHLHGGITVLRHGKRPLVLCISLKGRMASEKWEEAYNLGGVDIGVAYPKFEITKVDRRKYVILHLNEPIIKIGLSKTPVYNPRLPKFAFVPESYEAEAIEKAGRRLRRRVEKAGKPEEEKQEDLSEWKIFEKSG
jgi:hypothetical protein